MSRRLLKPARVSVLLGLVALTGCAGFPAGQTPSPTEAAASAVPTPSPTEAAASAAPTPSLTPAIDPADPTHWIISFDGIGPLQLGKPYSTSNPSLAEFAPDGEVYCDPRVHTLNETQGALADRLGLTVRLDQGSDTIYDQVAMGLRNQIAGRVEGPKTEKGIGIGSSQADTLAAYPTGVSEDIRPEVPNGMYLSVPSGTGHYLLFYFGTGGPVTAIDVQTFPENVWEYC